MNPDQARIKNIIDMAFTFSAMTRVFKEDSASKIKEKLESALSQLTSSKSEQEFRDYHDGFCHWFIDEIKTAKRKKKNGLIKKSAPASYGQGAKVLDVALKVFVHYCHLPDPEAAERINKWLNAAVDTKMLKYLKKMPDIEASSIRATAIERVDEKTYAILQRLVRRDINNTFAGSILPVEWDDIMFRQLNKKFNLEEAARHAGL